MQGLARSFAPAFDDVGNLFFRRRMLRQAADYGSFRYGASVFGAGLTMMPVAAFETANAEPGEMLPTAGASVVNNLVVFPITAVASALAFRGGVRLAGRAFGFAERAEQVAKLGAPFFGMLVGGSVGYSAQNRIIKGYRVLNDVTRRMRRLETGVDFEDSQAGYALRMQALQELTGTVANARGVLGQEARLLHR